MTYQLNDDNHDFPDISWYGDEINEDDTFDGLVAIGGDLSPRRVLRAYASGIFPWFSKDDPILWWSPNPRLILKLEDFHLSKNLKRTLNKKKFAVHIDRDFDAIITECAHIKRAGQEDTWILPEMIAVYRRLFDMGYVHCVGAYLDGVLVGGLYGVALGGMFCGESMFAKESDASKVAFAHLVDFLKRNDFDFIDCQTPSNHLKSLGAKEIIRSEFVELLHQTLEKPTIKGRWV